MISPLTTLTDLRPPSPAPASEGHEERENYLWDVFPRLHSRCSLTPGYYLSPRRRFQFPPSLRFGAALIPVDALFSRFPEASRPRKWAQPTGQLIAR
jgi:hypothetical protein